MSYVGRAIKRGDDPRLLTGRGRYVDDITLPRMVQVAFVRSLHAHARLAHVDVIAARDVITRRCQRPSCHLLFGPRGPTVSGRRSVMD